MVSVFAVFSCLTVEVTVCTCLWRQDDLLNSAYVHVIRESHVARVRRYVLNDDFVTMRAGERCATLPLDFVDAGTVLPVKVRVHSFWRRHEVL